MSRGSTRARSLILAVAAFALGAVAMRIVDRTAPTTRAEYAVTEAGGVGAHADARADASHDAGGGEAPSAGTARGEAGGPPGSAPSRGTAAPAADAAPAPDREPPHAADGPAGTASEPGKLVRVPLDDAGGLLDGVVALFSGSRPDLNQAGLSEHWERDGHLNLTFADKLSIGVSASGVLVNGIDQALGTALQAELKRRGHPRFLGVNDVYVLDALPHCSLTLNNLNGEWLMSILHDTPLGPG